MQQRLPGNKNLILHTDSTYKGYEVITHRGPLILQYLDRTYDAIMSTTHVYPRVTGIRADLYYSKREPLPPDAHTNQVLKRFFGSLNAKVENNRRNKVHDTTVRYVWCREYCKKGWPHFHTSLLFNGNAYDSLGWFQEERDNLYWRIVGAWATALGIPVQKAVGLVNIPDEPLYRIGRDPMAFEKFFYRTSYLSKVESKRFGGWCHAFDTSRH